MPTIRTINATTYTPALGTNIPLSRPFRFPPLTETKIVEGWFGPEYHYYLDGILIGAIVTRTTVSNSPKLNYTRFETRRGRNTRRSSYKKFFVVVPDSPVITGPFYEQEAVNFMREIFTRNA